MKAKTFKQVFIRSEADLPKEDGVYFAHKPKMQTTEVCCRWRLNDKERKRCWMETVDWYLIEQGEKPEFIHNIGSTTNFIVKPDVQKSVDFVQTRDLTDEEWLKLPKKEILQLYKNCYKLLLEAYRNQSLPEISDKEIKKSCPQELINRISCWIQGAKWYISEIHNRLNK